MHAAPDENPTRPYGTIRPAEPGNSDPPWNRPNVAVVPPIPGYGTNDWHPGPTHRTEVFPWLVGGPRFDQEDDDGEQETA